MVYRDIADGQIFSANWSNVENIGRQDNRTHAVPGCPEARAVAASEQFCCRGAKYKSVDR
jgi:precorrin-4 methylase